jgi:hypothetical protein
MEGIMNYRAILTAVSIALVVSGCGTTSVRKSSTATFEWSSPSKRVVLVEPDVELGALEASGGFEVRADWTATAQGFISKDVAEHVGRKGAELVEAERLTDTHEIQLSKLHSAVGRAILLHLYNPQLKLPNKGDALDWTLGSGTNDMRKHYGADYALFVYVRDSYTSAGRALMMVGAALFGVGIQGGQQTGFASLVDLRTGNIVWFNRILNGSGDLRTAEPAKKTVDDLLKEMPL